MTADNEHPAKAYILGHSERELERLTTQARLIDPITRQFFTEAGIAPGMRVLDIGSGAGDVALLLAGLVGPTGEVVGTDRSAPALAKAEARVKQRGFANVTFRQGDPTAMKFERPFDAMAGRWVLMFQPDPVAMLRKLKAHVRPGGVIVFHEPDWENVRSHPAVPTYERCCKWMVETLRRDGVHTRMGIELYAAFLAAGLPAPSMRLQALIAGGANASDEVHLKTDLAITLVADMERLGVATAPEVDAETLGRRVLAEMAATNAVIVHRADIAAWCRT